MKFLYANRIAPDGTSRSVWGFSVCVCPIKGTPGLNELRLVLVVESWIKSVQPGVTKNCHFLLLLLLLLLLNELRAIKRDFVQANHLQ